MAETAPIRPQRIIRANRETTGGLLMSVIRSLTTSRDSADRDRERLELEKGFQQCDSKLNELISQHGNDLYQVMTTFSKILTNLSRAKERLIDTRDKLLNSQKLLHCKRDELKKLWLEILENRAVYNLLERIEQVSSLPRQVEAYAEKKHYLHAGQCCVDGLRQLGLSQQQHQNGIDQLNCEQMRSTMLQSNASQLENRWNSLNKIEALAEVRSELLAKKEMLFERCIDELHRHIYSVATEDIRKRFQHEQQQQRLRTIESNHGLISDSSSLIASNRKPLTIYDNLRSYDLVKNEHDAEWQTSIITSSATSTTTNQSSNGDFDAYPEEDSRQFISMLTKCIGLLNKIPDAVKMIKERFDEEFVNLVIRTAQDILTMNHDSIGSGQIDTLTTTTTIISNQQALGVNHIEPSISFMDLSTEGLAESSFSSMCTGTPQQSSEHDLAVLTCTRLLGYRYNGFSHLQSRKGAKKWLTAEKYQLPRTSLQLRQLFDILMKQFYYVIQLHESIVLFNFKRIESSLHLATVNNVTPLDSNCDLDQLEPDDTCMTQSTTAFYSCKDICYKIQLLIQQLLDYYLDISQISGQTSSSGPSGAINYNLLSSLLPSAAVNMLFGASNSMNASSSSMVQCSNNTTVTSIGSYSENYSSFFLKRRPMMVAGAMNAMNVMMMNTGKNNLAVSNVSQPTSGNSDQNPESTGHHSTNSASCAGDVTNPGSVTGGHGQLALQPTSGHNLLQTFTQAHSHWRSTQSNLFKFDHSTQAISWNSFLQQQQRQADSGIQSQENDNGGTEGEMDVNDANHLTSTVTSSNNKSSINGNQTNNINNRLFDSLQSICHQSPDNLVLLYDILLQHVQKCPLTSSNNAQTSHINSENNSPKQNSLNILHSYLMTSSEKFTQHINSQLDAMLEQAQKSLESGVTILLQADKQHISSSEQISSEEKVDQSMTNSAVLSTSLPGHNVALLLESAVLVDVAVRDLNVLMLAMTDYRQHYLGYICNVLSAYKDTCKRLYDTVTTESSTVQISTSTLASNSMLPMSHAASSLDLPGQPYTMVNVNNAERRSILSAYWARNEDINRLLKSQPNWIQLQMASQKFKHGSAPVAAQKSQQHFRRQMMINRQMSTSLSFDVESPEDVHQRNASEIDILMKLLSQEITRQELLWNEGQVTLLANMQQSFEWLSARCDDLVQLIQQQQTNNMNDDQQQSNHGSTTDPSEVYIATLNQLSSDFKEISQLCLLVLHLEIRVHCCYHLQALDAQFFITSAPSTMMQSSVTPMDHSFGAGRASTSNTCSDLSDDSRIMPLLEDLQRIYGEVSAAQLSTNKMSYLFEGLGHLIAAIFINSAMSVRRVKPNGIKRTCRAIYDIQRRLSTLTKSRELALDYARQYFEMLLLTPEEILSSIIERGRQFKPQEYASAITLLHQSGLSQSGSSLEPTTNAKNLDQHQSNQQLQRLLKRLSDILAEVTC